MSETREEWEKRRDADFLASVEKSMKDSASHARKIIIMPCGCEHFEGSLILISQCKKHYDESQDS